MTLQICDENGQRDMTPEEEAAYLAQQAIDAAGVTITVESPRDTVRAKVGAVVDAIADPATKAALQQILELL